MKMSPKLAIALVNAWKADARMYPDRFSTDIETELHHQMEAISGNDYIPGMTARMFLRLFCREASELLWDGRIREAAKRLLRGLHSDMKDFSMRKHIGGRSKSRKGGEVHRIVSGRGFGKYQETAHDWHYVKPVRSKRG